MVELKSYLNGLTPHDRLIEATVRILSAYGFQVKQTVKGKRIDVKGDSGSVYYPDILAEKGPWKLIAEIRTRNQRGTGNQLDRGAVQFMAAELADLQSVLKRPHGMLVTPHGIDTNAKPLADHFGIIIGLLPFPAVDKILGLDFHAQKEQILDIARELKLVF